MLPKASITHRKGLLTFMELRYQFSYRNMLENIIRFFSIITVVRYYNRRYLHNFPIIFSHFIHISVVMDN